MNLTLSLALVLVAQTPGDVHFRRGDAVDVIARLTPEQQKAIPVGPVSAEAGEALLHVARVDEKTGKAGAPMIGRYERERDLLIFRPRFGFERGLLYRAAFAGRSDNFRPALANNGVPAQVDKIFPSADVLPANHLKFHIHFTAPMRGGRDIFEQIQILDQDGVPITDVWLHDELWDATGTHLILYIHPGRIKWGLVLREILGPVLVPRRDYTLVIRGAMLDANGQKLGKDVTKKFRTTAEDRVRVDLAEWKITPPAAGGALPVEVAFSKSIDRDSLSRFLTIVDSRGNAVAGNHSVGAKELTWSFTPKTPWAAEEFSLRIDPRMEDVAGNTPVRPFDMDLDAPSPPRQRLDLPFRPK